jgi:hypothetical protein
VLQAWVHNVSGRAGLDLRSLALNRDNVGPGVHVRDSRAIGEHLGASSAGSSRSASSQASTSFERKIGMEIELREATRSTLTKRGCSAARAGGGSVQLSRACVVTRAATRERCTRRERERERERERAEHRKC